MPIKSKGNNKKFEELLEENLKKVENENPGNLDIYSSVPVSDDQDSETAK